MTDLSYHAKVLFNEFVSKVEQDLITVVESNKNRFPSGDRLINRYRDAISRVRKGGYCQFKEFHEVHNELCTAVVILEDKSEPMVQKLEYEPQISKCDKRFDFHVMMSDNNTRYLELKTIHPISQDDWYKYQKALMDKRFPENTHFILDKQSLGGELYHNFYSARSKMLDYTIDIEKKIESCLDNPKTNAIFLVLFSNGFAWYLEELEDFVFFYRKGKHFPGDPFAQMEDYFIKEREILLSGSIHCFSYFRRPKLEVRPNKVVWNVDLPSVPSWLT